MLELIEKAQQGDKAAAEQLVLENAGLIWSIARRYFGRGVEADDLYQLGALGFLKAVSGFDTQYGTQFSTYAVPKIAGEIRRGQGQPERQGARRNDQKRTPAAHGRAWPRADAV